MAKYVGKVFKLPDRKLGIKGNGAHMVKITWYNPFKRVFHGRVITSLENRETISESEKKNLHLRTFHKESDSTYLFMNRSKYEKLRNGQIIPIPVHKASGLSVWSGYSGNRKIHIKTLKGQKALNIKIKK